MNRKILGALLALAALFALACRDAGNSAAGVNGAANGAANVAAPGGATGAGGGTTTGATGGGTAAARDVIATLPDSKAVGFAYVGRILTNALPAAGAPEADLRRMYEDAQRDAGFDPRSIDVVVAAIRYTEPITPNTYPEFLVVAKGSFNAADLIARMRAKEKNPSREENYKGRTLNIVSTSNPAIPSSRPLPYPEIAVTTFDTGTIVGGVPAYVRAAIDAADGGARVRPDLIDLAAGNSDALVSFAGDVPPSLVDLLRSAGGVGTNPDAERAFRAIRQLQFSLGMTSTDYTLNTRARTDTPENANWMSSTGTTQLGQLKQMLQAQLNQSPPNQVEQMQLMLNILSSVNITSSGSEVRVDMSVPINTIRTLVQKNNPPRP